MNITTTKRTRAEGNDMPTKLFAKHSDGTWSYNFDIIEVEKEDETMHGEEDTQEKTTKIVYQYYNIDFGGIFSKDEIKKHVMDYLWGVDYENKLMNEYNAYKEGISQDASVETKYKTFLQERKDAMDKVQTDWDNLNK